MVHTVEQRDWLYEDHVYERIKRREHVLSPEVRFEKFLDERMRKGKETYGSDMIDPWDGREFTKETFEEIGDGVNYLRAAWEKTRDMKIFIMLRLLTWVGVMFLTLWPLLYSEADYDAG